MMFKIMILQALYSLSDDRRRAGRLTQSEAAGLLGMSEPTFRRYSRRYEAKGAECLFDRRLAKVPQNRVCVDTVVEMLTFFDTRDLNICARSTTTTIEGGQPSPG